MRVLPCGEHALLIEVDDLTGVLALDAALLATPLPGAIDVVPAARTVLVRFAPGADLVAARRRLDQLRPDAALPPALSDTVIVSARYDGADLDQVADALSMSRAELISAHTGAEWTVAFCGFAPGFAYLTGDDSRLAGVRRRATPRTRVPAGSVALAGGFSAVYPTDSPGGWNLLGRTELRVFDVDRNPAAVLTPGTRVRFVDDPGPDSRAATSAGGTAARKSQP